MQQELDWGSSAHLHLGLTSPCGDTAKRDETLLQGEVAFASAEEQSQRSAELLGAGALLITLPAPTRDGRGHLAEMLEELVERELARLGAPSPYLAAWGAMAEDAQARLADQLFRARTVGSTGIAIAMGTLGAIASPVLTPDDSATLRWLAETTREAPLVLLIDDSDLGVLGYAAPAPLAALMMISGSSPSSSSSPTVTLTGDDATANDTRVVASIDLGEAILQAPPSAADVVVVAAPEHEEEEEEEEELVVTIEEPIKEPEPARLVSPIVPLAPPIVPSTKGPVEAVAADPPPPPPPAPEPQPVVTAAALDETPETKDKELSHAARYRAARRVTAGIPVSSEKDAWRTWTIALAGAKGAQPLATFERLFAESYVPLANAIASGLEDPRALRAYDEFRRSFERSYTDAFATFGATNRRPRLVMDAYDIASKQARLSNARSAHILVIDSMRYDLGCLVRDAVGREAAGIATLTSEIVLWSALPTTTMRQLETFARGLDALRDPAREEPSESLRGRAAEVVRRLRVGSRELFKLDLVPSMLETRVGSNQGQGVAAALDEIAGAVAEAIARHISTLPPRTLLFLVGDHGFSLGRRGEIQFGGASPEEVIVPAYSWLIGELH